MAPSLCGSLVTSKKSLLALGWSFTFLLSLAAFVTAALYAVHIRSHYRYIAMENGASNYDYNNYYNNNCDGDEDGDGDGCRSHDSRDDRDDPSYYYNSLASVSSTSMTFAGIYTASVAVGLSLYGSLAIVGFSSVKGKYIAPCLGGSGSAVSSRIHLGIFMGALVLFSCLCLVCAVIFGEFRVEGYMKDDIKDEVGAYAVERIAAVLAGLCMFLAVLYFSYSILLFSFKEDILADMIDGRKEMELGGLSRAGGGLHSRSNTRDSGYDDVHSHHHNDPGMEYQPPLGVGTAQRRSLNMDSAGFITQNPSESF